MSAGHLGRVVGVALLLTLWPSAARAGERLTVLVPSDKNLQHMSFWVAKAGGYFERAGVDVEIVTAPSPQQTEAMFERGEVDGALLAPPMYLRFIAAKMPLVLVANLLRNDPIDLVVRPEIMAARKLTPAMPLKERLQGLHGLKLGIAPHPPTRLRALYATQGLDADKELELVILRGPEQNAAFTEKRVDALYAHTPYLEKAIVQDGAMMLVEQTRGEVKELANRQIHCLAVRRAVSVARSNAVLAAVRAIGEAEHSIHASQKDTVDVLARAFPERDRRELEVIVRLYEPAIPDSPDVHVEDLAPALALFPDGMPKPDLTGMDLAPYVGTAVAPLARAGEVSVTRTRWIAVAAAVACIVGALLAILTVRRKPKTE
jgi:ABC-type nitrate/sulfonate/bicarbonate transport system substrate-binding protein